jgi:UDP-glucose 4-epimerase
VKIFITGVAGFLGSHLADAMLAEGHEVIGVDNLMGRLSENSNSPIY